MSIAFRLALPVGLTWHRIQGGPSRANEAYSMGHGWNFGLVAGGDVFFGKHHGFYVEATYTRHLTWLTRTATSQSDPTLTGSEEYHYVQQTWLLGAGYAFRF